MNTFRWTFADIGMLVAVCLYSLYIRSGLVAGAQGPTAWDQVLLTCLNPKMFIFLLIPLLLYRAVKGNERGWGEMALMRHSSWWGWLRSRLVVAVFESGKLELVALVASFLGSVGLRYFPAGTSSPNFDVALIGRWSPVSVLVFSSVFQICFLFSFYLLIAVITLLVGRYASIAVGALLFLDLAFTASAPAPVPLLNFVDGLDFVAALRDWGLTPTAMLTPSIVVAGIAVVLVALAHGRAQGAGLRKMASGRSLMLIVLVLVVTLWSITMPVGSAYEAFFAVFVGSSPDNPYLPIYLLHVLMFLTPVVVFGLELEEKLDASIYLRLVRYGGVVRWSVRLVAGAGLRYMAYVVGLGVYVACLALLRFGRQGNSGGMTLIVPGDMVLQYLVNGVLQGWCYIMFVFLARWVSGRAVSVAVAIAVLVAGGFTLASRGFPAALNSFALIRESGNPNIYSLRLVCWLFLTGMFLFVSGKWFGVQLLERNTVE